MRRARTEPAALGELYDRYVGRIHGFVAGQVSDRAAAEDITAEVFMRALRGVGRSRPSDQSCSAWLFGIAVDAVDDHHRRRQGCREQPLQIERSGSARRRTAG